MKHYTVTMKIDAESEASLVNILSETICKPECAWWDFTEAEENRVGESVKSDDSIERASKKEEKKDEEEDKKVKLFSLLESASLQVQRAISKFFGGLVSGNNPEDSFIDECFEGLSDEETSVLAQIIKLAFELRFNNTSISEGEDKRGIHYKVGDRVRLVNSIPKGSDEEFSPERAVWLGKVVTIRRLLTDENGKINGFEAEECYVDFPELLKGLDDSRFYWIWGLELVACIIKEESAKEVK